MPTAGRLKNNQWKSKAVPAVTTVDACSGRWFALKGDEPRPLFAFPGIWWRRYRGLGLFSG
jgi:hypothetical protein